jgi:hypothetical protein
VPWLHASSRAMQAELFTSFGEIAATFRTIWLNCAMLALSFFVTILFYPGIASSVAPVFIDPTWLPLLILTAFNVVR